MRPLHLLGHITHSTLSVSMSLSLSLSLSLSCLSISTSLSVACVAQERKKMFRKSKIDSLFIYESQLNKMTIKYRQGIHKSKYATEDIKAEHWYMLNISNIIISVLWVIYKW